MSTAFAQSSKLIRWVAPSVGATCVIFLILFAVSALAPNTVLIQSGESNTSEGLPVFNKITFFKRGNLDIWMMNQSHHGIQALDQAWERLAIIVDTSTSPKTARFYQLKNGPLEWNESLPETSRVSFRVSCFMCHTNGPRAVRPDTDLANIATNSFSEKIKIAVWNLKIKTYGRVVAHSDHEKEDPSLEVPFRPHGRFENEALKVATCVKCHSEDGLISRGPLTRLNTLTIRHMVKSGIMPPLGFSLSDAESAELERFTRGF